MPSKRERRKARWGEGRGEGCESRETFPRLTL